MRSQSSQLATIYIHAYIVHTRQIKKTEKEPFRPQVLHPAPRTPSGETAQVVFPPLPPPPSIILDTKPPPLRYSPCLHES